MSNFLTDGRLALVAALQGDAAIDGRVKTYFDFGPGLGRRHAVEPSICPLLSVAPSEAAELPVGNVESDVPQVLRVEVATAGQDVQPCEELVALVMARVQACNQDCLSLAADGLTGLRAESVSWASEPHDSAARLIWTAAITVRLVWRRI